MVNQKSRAVPTLNVDAEMINSEFEKLARIDHDMGDSTYRHDGFSIGKDYLRLEGRTIGRGELLPGSLLVRQMLGQGAFSKVYKAAWKRKHDETSIFVAIKEFCLIASSDNRQDMLMKELRTLCRINCESLLRLEGAFLSDDKVTLVLEFMDRGSLEDIIKAHKRGGLAAEEGFTASVAYQMLCGLSYLHRECIMHRDLKPGNVLLDTKGNVKLCDFGLASLSSDHSLQTTMVGTTFYMAPERLRAQQYGRSSDLWSFGLVILECMTGEIPWKDRDIVSLLVSIEDTSIYKLTSNLRPLIQEVLHMCLQLRPEKRVPANVLLKSPWLLVEHGIKALSDARRLIIHQNDS